jgi:hypothetical protein
LTKEISNTQVILEFPTSLPHPRKAELCVQEHGNRLEHLWEESKNEKVSNSPSVFSSYAQVVKLRNTLRRAKEIETKIIEFKEGTHGKYSCERSCKI